MKCLRCDEGTIVKVKFKKTGKTAYLCDFCEALWFEGDKIDSNTAHTLSLYREKDMEYTLDENEDKDQEHRSVYYSGYK